VVEYALVGLFQDHEATALDARVVGVDCGGDEVGEGDVGDEAATLVHLQPGFFAILPLGNAHLAVQHAGVDAHVGDGFGEHEGAAPGLAVLSRLRRSGQRLVVGDLLLGAALVNGRESQEAGEAGGGRAAVHPGQLEGRQRQRQVLGPVMKPPSSGSMKTAVSPARSKASSISLLAGVHSWVLRSPAATRRATVPRATPRADWTSICKSNRSAKRH